MKIIKIMLFLGMLFIPLSSYASTISYDQFTAASTIADLNTAVNRIYIDYDGNITSANLATGAVNSDDIATAANPLVRDAEHIGEYVYTGLTLPTSGAFATSTITSGTAYILNDGDSTLHRVVKGSTVIGTSLTANKDNYVYLDYAGAYAVTTVNVGATQPTTPDNSIVLGYITTGAVNITTASESARQTIPPNLRVYQDAKIGLVLSRDISTAGKVNLNRGMIDFGTSVTNGLRRNTATADITFTTTGRGGLDTGSLAQGYYYIWAVADDDNSTNYEGVGSLSKTATSLAITGERLVGWCYAPNASTISPDSVGAYRGRGGDAPNTVFRVISQDLSTASTSYVDIPGLETRFYSSGRPVSITFNAPIINTGNNSVFVVVDVDGIDYGSARTGSAAASIYDQVGLTYTMNLSEGTHYIKPQWRVDGNTGQINGTTAGPATILVDER